MLSFENAIKLIPSRLEAGLFESMLYVDARVPNMLVEYVEEEVTPMNQGVMFNDNPDAFAAIFASKAKSLMRELLAKCDKDKNYRLLIEKDKGIMGLEITKESGGYVMNWSAKMEEEPWK